jgi:hypothetical protein
MSAHWHIRRAVRRDNDGQRRWDVAYQCLLQWMDGPPQEAPARAGSDPQLEEEGEHGGRRVPAGLDQAPAADAQR